MTDISDLYEQIRYGQRKTITRDYVADPWETLQRIVDALGRERPRWLADGRAQFADAAREIITAEILQNAIDAEAQAVVND